MPSPVPVRCRPRFTERTQMAHHPGSRWRNYPNSTTYKRLDTDSTDCSSSNRRWCRCQPQCSKRCPRCQGPQGWSCRARSRLLCSCRGNHRECPVFGGGYAAHWDSQDPQLDTVRHPSLSIAIPFRGCEAARCSRCAAMGRQLLF